MATLPTTDLGLGGEQLVAMVTKDQSAAEAVAVWESWATRARVAAA